MTAARFHDFLTFLVDVTINTAVCRQQERRRG